MYIIAIIFCKQFVKTQRRDIDLFFVKRFTSVLFLILISSYDANLEYGFFNTFQNMHMDNRGISRNGSIIIILKLVSQRVGMDETDQGHLRR